MPRQLVVHTPNALLLLLLAVGRPAAAQVPLPEPDAAPAGEPTAVGHDVVVSVSEIYELAVSASAVALTIGAPAAGEGPSQALDATSTYAVTTNGEGQKITAALSAAYADGVRLSVELASPAGATATTRELATTALDLVTGLTRVAAESLSITYTATADVSAAPTSGTGGETRTVTFTLTDG